MSRLVVRRSHQSPSPGAPMPPESPFCALPPSSASEVSSTASLAPRATVTAGCRHARVVEPLDAHLARIARAVHNPHHTLHRAVRRVLRCGQPRHPVLDHRPALAIPHRPRHRRDIGETSRSARNQTHHLDGGVCAHHQAPPPRARAQRPGEPLACARFERGGAERARTLAPAPTPTPPPPTPPPHRRCPRCAPRPPAPQD